jgi:hypothetical protein
MSEHDALPPGYEILTTTMFGTDARLNRGLMSLRANTYLCYSREAPGPPVTDLIVIYTDEGEMCPAGTRKKW